VQLQHLRLDSNPAVLSVDAICISQGNIHERNHQVNQITLIHEQATRVIAWLGASEASSMELISSYQGGHNLSNRQPIRKYSMKEIENSLLFMPFLLESIGADFRSTKNSYLRKSSYSSVVVINVLRFTFPLSCDYCGVFQRHLEKIQRSWRARNDLGSCKLFSILCRQSSCFNEKLEVRQEANGFRGSTKPGQDLSPCKLCLCSSRTIKEPNAKIRETRLYAFAA
jgi:hypothetical protein